MKKYVIIQLLAFLLAPVIFYSCDKDDNEPVVLVPKLSGLYVFGTNTVADVAVNPNAKMAKAVLNPGKSGGDENREGVYGKLMHIGANSTIQFTYVDTLLVAVNYGAVDDGRRIAGADLGKTDVKDTIISDTLIVDEDPIQITGEGLYYVYVDYNTLEFRIMKVRAHMIGDATLLQWTAGNPMPEIFSSVDSSVFEITDLQLKGSSGYKYMFNDGWELYNDGNMALHTHLGVESYGTSWETGINNIGYWGENIPHKEDGMFTVNLKYTAATGEWKETKTKTGMILIDYSATQMSLFGNACVLAPGDTANWVSGSDGYGLHVPVKTGTVYTWTWNDVNLIEGREFIFLENGTWGGLQLDWSMLTSVGGKAITGGNLVDATTTGGQYHNFQVVVGGVYDLTLVIDAAAETKVVTIISGS